MHGILFVDDEQNILNSIRRILRKAPYQLFTSNTAESGLEVIKKHPISLVVSDFRMPGLDGITFLERVQKYAPDTIRILLTGFTDAESAIRAINSGQVFRYLKKPIRETDLLEALRTGLQQYELITENRRLMELTQKQNAQLRKFNQELEKKVQNRTREIAQKKQEVEKLYFQLEASFTDTIRSFLTVIEMKNPKIGGHSRRVAALARRMAEHLKMPPNVVRDLEVAGLLHDIGKITMPDSILQQHESQLSEDEYTLLQAHPEIGASIIEDIQSLKAVSAIICAHHERFDGKGYPKKLRGKDIPIGARLLSVINSFDNLISQENLEKPLRYELAINHLQSGSGSYFDPQMATAFIEYLKKSRRPAAHRKEKPIKLSDLVPGMVLSRDIMTQSGLLLLGKDQVLNHSLIRRLNQYHVIDPLASQIFIYE